MTKEIHPVGIDLGTTWSAVAYVTSTGKTEVLRNSENELFTPSVVLFDDDETTVGKRAREAGPDCIDRIAECAKRDMGLSVYHRPIGDRQLPPEAIQGFILHKLRNDTAATLGEHFQAVIAVPAYFDESRRQATIDAAKVSNLDILDIVNEPTAAALAFGQMLGYLTPDGEVASAMNVLVFDLGGGTFDLSVLRMKKGDITTLATNGDVRLGGYDWDRRLVEHVKSIFTTKYPDAPRMDQTAEFYLRRSAEQAKHALTDNARTSISFEHAGMSIQVDVTRRQFEELTEDLLERTAFTTRQTVREANLVWSDINRILLVGGSTRMPMVREMVSNLSGHAPETTIDPDQAVARGAAIYAHNLLAKHSAHSYVPKLRITDVASHSLGIEGIDINTLRKENITLIPKNCALPRKVYRNFVTRKDDQRSVLIRLLEGESKQPEHCSELAQATIKHLPPGLPEGTKIRVTYSYDASGRLSVDAHMHGFGENAEIVLQRFRSLPNARLDRWKKVICHDGGYNDFEEGLCQVLEEENPAASVPENKRQKTDKPTQANRIPLSLTPAVDMGAPLAAAEALQEEVSTVQLATQATENTIRKRRTISNFVNLAGHILFSLLGLVIGYYLLCWMNPRYNFLDLDLPGLTDMPPSANEVNSLP